MFAVVDVHLAHSHPAAGFALCGRYEALAHKTRDHVAVKVIKKNRLATPEDVQMVYLEAEVLSKVSRRRLVLLLFVLQCRHLDSLCPSASRRTHAQLHHPHIIEVYGLYEGRDEFYIVMELFKHGTLLDTITQRERYTEDDARAIVQTLAETLGYCHKQGFMHRDVKVRVRVPPTCMCGTSQIRRSLTLPPRQPANIVSTANGSIKLADFGFATTVDFDAVHQFYNDCGTMAYVVFTTVTRACHSPRQAQPNSPAAAVILNCDSRTLPPFAPACSQVHGARDGEAGGVWRGGGCVGLGCRLVPAPLWQAPLPCPHNHQRGAQDCKWLVELPATRVGDRL